MLFHQVHRFMRKSTLLTKVMNKMRRVKVVDLKQLDDNLTILSKEAMMKIRGGKKTPRKHHHGCGGILPQ